MTMMWQPTLTDFLCDTSPQQAGQATGHVISDSDESQAAVTSGATHTPAFDVATVASKNCVPQGMPSGVSPYLVMPGSGGIPSAVTVTAASGIFPNMVAPSTSVTAAAMPASFAPPWPWQELSQAGWGTQPQSHLQ